MMRPSDQAKLLFLYLLRSSSALATRATTAASTSTATTTTTTTTTTSSSSAAAAAAAAVASKSALSSFPSPSSPSSSSSPSSQRMLEGHISLRLATRLDVPSIQRCNLASLPENYSSNFYVNHIRSFPDLALVAEHVPPGAAGSEGYGNGNGNGSGHGAGKSTNGGRRNPFEAYNPSVPESQIIGYVLGKIEQAPPPASTSTSTSTFSPSRVSTGNDDLDDYFYQQELQQQQSNNNNNNINNNSNSRMQQQQPPQPEILGHVTSLAVLKPYRRRGLAAMLMKQLHFHMKYAHRATAVGLHVRVSNVAARRLYCEGMGYGVVDVIRGYYADGEDAFFMKKDLNFLLNGDGNGASASNGNGNGSRNSNIDIDVDDDEYRLEEEMMRLMAPSNGGNVGNGGVQTQQPMKSIGSRWSSFRRRNTDLNESQKSSAIYENGPLEFRLPMIIPLNNQENTAAATSSGGGNGSKMMTDDVPAMVDDSSEEEDEEVMTGSL